MTKMSKWTTLLAVAVAALVGANFFIAKTPADAAKALHHEAGADLTGYYIPEWNPQTGVSADYRTGSFRLSHIAIGSPAELTKYETTGPDADLPNYAPFMIEFDDTSSTQGENELGQTYYAITERVLPDTYNITTTSVSFKGTGATLGQVTFTATAEPEKIKAARNNPAHISDGPALTGTLTIGDTVIEDVKLMWYGGE